MKAIKGCIDMHSNPLYSGCKHYFLNSLLPLSVARDALPCLIMLDHVPNMWMFVQAIFFEMCNAWSLLHKGVSYISPNPLSKVLHENKGIKLIIMVKFSCQEWFSWASEIHPNRSTLHHYNRWVIGFPILKHNYVANQHSHDWIDFKFHTD